MITPSFGLTATERVLPKLALDFTTGSLDSRVTFTRTTDATHPATYINSIGVLTAATNNEARFDYDPVTLVCKGLLIEESRTNLATYSQSVGGTGWTTYIQGTGVTPVVVLNAGTAPDGSNNASKVTLDKGVGVTSGDRSLLQKSVSGVTNGATYSASIYVKAFDVADVGKQIRLTADNMGATQVVLTSSWQRVVFTGAAVATTVSVGVEVRGTNAASADVLVWGAQLEAGAFATSYIPTTTAALTRNADVAVMTGTNFSDWFNATEGTFVASYSNKAIGIVIRVMQDSNNLIQITQTSTTQTTCSIRKFGTFVASFIFTAPESTPHTGSISYKLNNIAGSVDGQSVLTSGSGLIPSPTYMEIGSTAGVYFANGHIESIRFYSQRVTNQEVQSLSK